jgi:hypothetical protein
MMVFNSSAQYSKLPIELHSYLLAYNLGVGHYFGFSAPRQVPMVVHIEHPTPGADDQAPNPKEPRYSVSFDHNPSGHFSIHTAIGNVNPAIAFVGPPPQPPAPPPDPQSKLSENDDLSNIDMEDDDVDHAASDATWKQRFMKLRSQMQRKDRALSQYKRKIVESVMADI